MRYEFKSDPANFEAGEREPLSFQAGPRKESGVHAYHLDKIKNLEVVDKGARPATKFQKDPLGPILTAPKIFIWTGSWALFGVFAWRRTAGTLNI